MKPLFLPLKRPSPPLQRYNHLPLGWVKIPTFALAIAPLLPYEKNRIISLIKSVQMEKLDTCQSIKTEAAFSFENGMYLTGTDDHGNVYLCQKINSEWIGRKLHSASLKDYQNIIHPDLHYRKKARYPLSASNLVPTLRAIMENEEERPRNYEGESVICSKDSCKRKIVSLKKPSFSHPNIP
jgi:hypothetical protein